VKTGFVVLAAGAGQRMGGIAKCLIEFDGSSLLERLLREMQVLRHAVPHELVLVLGHHAPAIQARLAQWPETIVPPWVVNAQPDDDTASSLRVGLGALGPEVQQVGVLLADQPLIDSADVQAAWQAFAARAPGIQVQVPVVDGQPGHPVMLDASVCAQLAASPALSLRQWRAAYPQAVRLWAVNNPHYTRDLDTPHDLQALAHEMGWAWRWPG
jgi:molybdenum cofactor cytidylyltransferase